MKAHGSTRIQILDKIVFITGTCIHAFSSANEKVYNGVTM